MVDLNNNKLKGKNLMEEKESTGEYNPKDKYSLVNSEVMECLEENDIRVRMRGQPSKYLKYGLHLLAREESKGTLMIKASGNAISKAFIVAELIKRKVKGLHQ